MNAAIIRAIRGTISQPGFARLLGVTTVSVSRWENGHVKPVGPTRLLLELLAKDRGRVISLINSIRLDEATAKRRK